MSVLTGYVHDRTGKVQAVTAVRRRLAYGLFDECVGLLNDALFVDGHQS